MERNTQINHGYSLKDIEVKNKAALRGWLHGRENVRFVKGEVYGIKRLNVMAVDIDTNEMFEYYWGLKEIN